LLVINGSIKLKSIYIAIGIAPPIPFTVRENATTFPRSDALGVMTLGKHQNGTSLIE